MIWESTVCRDISLDVPRHHNDLSPKKWTTYRTIWPSYSGANMPKHYSHELRRLTCERMLAGEAVKDLVVERRTAEVTLYKWRRPA